MYDRRVKVYNPIALGTKPTWLWQVVYSCRVDTNQGKNNGIVSNQSAYKVNCTVHSTLEGRTYLQEYYSFIECTAHFVTYYKSHGLILLEM